MKKIILILIFLNLLATFKVESKEVVKSYELVTSTKQIYLEDFPNAFNPSIIKAPFGFLMTFRHCLAPLCPWISHIGIVMLDHELNVISKPTLLHTRGKDSITPPQSEDARIFLFNKKYYLIYNDNQDYINPSIHERRDMFIAELQINNGEFSLLEPLKIYHEKKYPLVNWQKNWVPFEWNNQLLMSYTVSPHEVLRTDLLSGLSKPIFQPNHELKWNLGLPRGGTPAVLVDGHYLAFFHSSIVTTSDSSDHLPMYHYYMGAYTFSSSPPFHIQKISSTAIIGDGFYTKSSCDKRVIFPGGFAEFKDHFYVAYGKDDQEIWIAKIHKKTLMKSLKKATKKP